MNTDTDPITVFWRPGCMFCSSLLRQLDGAGLAFGRVNIWEDEDAAAFVRGVAGGSETVPTVRVGSVALVNPTVREVVRAVAREAPEQLPEGQDPPPVSPLGALVDRLLGR